MNRGCVGEAAVYVAWLFGSAAIGATVGIVQIGGGLVLGEWAQGADDNSIIVLVGATSLVAVLLAGLGLCALARWALTKNQCGSLGVAVTMSLAACALALYSTGHGAMLAGYVSWFLQGTYASLWGAFLAALFHLVLGGLYWIIVLARAGTENPVGTMLLSLSLFSAIYYPVLVLCSAVRTVRRQQPIIQCLRSEPAALDKRAKP